MAPMLVNKKIPNGFEINHFLECRACAESCPIGMTLNDYQRVSVGLTNYGVQIWCTRHRANIIHFDFRGSRVQVNATKQNEVIWRATQ